MIEYEYEVKFYGSQWVINVLCYHEQDSEIGDTEIINWAIAVADQNGLTIPEQARWRILISTSAL